MTSDDCEGFARELRAYLVRRYGSLGEAAREIGVKPQGLSRLLHDPHNRKLSTLARIIEGLGGAVILRIDDGEERIEITF